MEHLPIAFWAIMRVIRWLSETKWRCVQLIEFQALLVTRTLGVDGGESSLYRRRRVKLTALTFLMSLVIDGIGGGVWRGYSTNASTLWL